MSNVTANKVAHQLLLNGKTQYKLEQREHPPWDQSDGDSTLIFTLKESINCLKNGKAAGLDDIRTEQIRHFGRIALERLLNC